MADTQTLIDKLAWIHLKDKKILMALTRGKDTYYIPGGKREAGESDHEALIREVREELSVVLRPDTIRHLDTFRAPAHGKPAGTIVQMTCYTADYDGNIAPSEEIEAVAWYAYRDKEKTGPVDQIIFDWLRERDMLAQHFFYDVRSNKKLPRAVFV